MKFDVRALREFARYYGFHYDIVDPARIKGDVLVDMERGLRGHSSSLDMIPAYINPVSSVPPGKTVIALDAGGTNYRAALVRFDEKGKAVPEQTEKSHMPGTKGKVGVEEFFDHLASLAAPLIEKNPNVEGIGFTFSYPMDVTKDMDGILRGFSKEVDAPDVIGKAIGAGLRDALARKKVKAPERIVLLNDTAATLLAGLVGKPGDVGAVVGFILGTGFNTAYPEKAIPKIGFDSQKPQIVVCETGGFIHRYMGILDREFDASTKNPGVFHLEKLTAGAYLGPLTFSIVRKAIADGLISFAGSDAFLAAIPTLQTKDLNMYLNEGIGPLKEFFDKDADARAAVACITSIVTERGARLASGVLAATVEKTGEGQNPLLPVRIAVEGTTYLIYRGMRPALESYLHALLAGKGIAYEITPVDQASLFGAAVAALSK